MQNITDVNTFTSPVTVLSDGDPVVAAESIPTAQALANRTLFNASGLRLTSTVSAAGTTVLTATSTRGQVLTGTAAQTFQLPDETTCAVGQVFEFFNLSTGILTVKDSGGTTIAAITRTNGYCSVISLSAGASTGNWQVSQTSPGHSLGTGSNDAAAAGEVGEIISLSRTSGSALTLTNGTTSNLFASPSLALTPGAWRISGMICLSDNTGNMDNVAFFYGISKTSATLPGALSVPVNGEVYNQAQYLFGSPTVAVIWIETVIIPAYTFSISANTSYFPVVQISDTTHGTLTAFGYVQAERAR